MSEQVRLRSIWKVLLEYGESSEPVGPVVAQQPSDGQPQQEEPTAESQILHLIKRMKMKEHLRFKVLTQKLIFRERAPAKTGCEQSQRGEVTYFRVPSKASSGA